MRIFVGPHEITGQYRNLAIAMRENGANCDYYTFENCPFKYGDDLGELRLPRVIRKVDGLRKHSRFFSRKLCSLVIDSLRFVFFVQCLFRYDAFIFGFGHSLLRFNLDLPLLRLVNKRVISNMSHGSDMTLPYLDGALLDAEGVMPSLRFLYRSSVKLKARAARFEKYADYIIGSPLSSSFLSTKPYISIFSIGRVSQGNRLFCPAQLVNEDKLTPQKEIFRILHAPSHAPGKGTNIIREVIQKLIKRGYCIEFREIMGVTNDVVVQELRKCDFVVDQVYADLPLSGLATEAACLGKPTVIAGYGLAKLSEVVGSDEMPPSIICHPELLEVTIAELLDFPEKIVAQGSRAEAFVKNQWSEKKVASNYLRLVSKEGIPSGWWHDPREMLYLQGYGLSENKGKDIACAMMKKYGTKGLALKHRPDLEHAFKEYLLEGKK